jgi:hypothetical protein
MINKIKIINLIYDLEYIYLHDTSEMYHPYDECSMRTFDYLYDK